MVVCVRVPEILSLVPEGRKKMSAGGVPSLIRQDGKWTDIGYLNPELLPRGGIRYPHPSGSSYTATKV